MATMAMGTVDKALALLRLFSVQTSELGLSELARLAGHDKATTLRCLTALERNGFVEQDPESRKYRLGLAPLHLAQIREHSFPVHAVLKRYLDQLSDETGETAHASLITSDTLLTAMVSEPDRALRVHVEPSGALPLHATASGVAILAFMPESQLSGVLDSFGYEAFTEKTPGDKATLTRLLDAARADGLGRMEQGYERDVTGTAAPVFGPAGQPIGSVAVAAVSLRMTQKLAATIDRALLGAASSITRELGGLPPSEPANDHGPDLSGRNEETGS